MKRLAAVQSETLGRSSGSKPEMMELRRATNKTVKFIARQQLCNMPSLVS